MSNLTRSQLVSDLEKRGLRLSFLGTSFQRGYVSRRQSSADNLVHASTRQGTFLSGRADFYILVPTWCSTQYCVREYYKVVPLSPCSRREAAS